MKITIDSQILENPNIRAVHINLYLHLIQVSHYGLCMISVTELMRDMRSSSNRHRVIEYLRTLEQEGYLKINSRNGATNRYELNQEFYSKEI